jgi:predicted negative regulator of RcsB-dependent stress response
MMPAVGLTLSDHVCTFQCYRSFAARHRSRGCGRLMQSGTCTYERMARHPTARRKPRESAPADDVFVERVFETSVWAKENARLLILTVTAVLVIAAGLLYYRNYRSRLRDIAETQLTQIRTTLMSGNTALAISDLENFMGRYGSTPTAAEAKVLLARAYLENKEPQKAIQTISGQASDLTDPIGVSSSMLLADAYEQAIQPDQAISTYLRVASNAPYDYQKRSALENAARIRAEQGDNRGAVELYDRILAALPADSPDRAVYELRRAEVAAKAGPAPSSG